MQKSSSPTSKLSTWITMLLVWNIVLLSIAIFYLFRIVQHPLNAQDLAAECANAITTSQSTGL